ncbi:MAG: serine hydrolase domain-containing protein [Pleomorphochaeta sp.]
MLNYNTLERIDTNSLNTLKRSYKDFYESLKDNNIELHSFALIKDDKLLLEEYTNFQKENDLHRMYSITKSVISIGIGLLIKQNKIKLDDKVYTYFKDKIDETTDKEILNMSIENLLSMQTCYNKTTYKKDLSFDWVKSFFISEVDHKCGTVFNYDSSGSHALCALIERLSNKNLIDFINDNLSPYFSFSKDAYMLKDPFGISMGASGLMCTTRDLINFALFLKNDCYNLIDLDYFKKATTKVVETKDRVNHEFETYGYGYQFWVSKHDGYFCYGKDGQLIIIIPSQKFIAITTADTRDIQGLFDHIFKYFLYPLSNL